MRIALKVLKIVAAIAASLYVLVCLDLFLTQRSILYNPQPRTNTTASSLMTLPVDGETANVSFHADFGQNALIYFGGNATDVSRDMPDLEHAFPGWALYGLHYPGYGGSSGSPSEKLIFDEALALFDRAHAGHANIVILGRSLGSGVAVWTASQRPVSRLVLVTPYDSMADPAQSHYPILPARWLLLDKYESWRYAPKVTAPTLIIVADQDEVIPPASAERLRTRFRSGIAGEVVLHGVGHNDVQGDPGYWALVRGK